MKFLSEVHWNLSLFKILLPTYSALAVKSVLHNVNYVIRYTIVPQIQLWYAQRLKLCHGHTPLSVYAMLDPVSAVLEMGLDTWRPSGYRQLQGPIMTVSKTLSLYHDNVRHLCTEKQEHISCKLW